MNMTKAKVKEQIENPYNSDKATMVAILMTLEEILHTIKEQTAPIPPAQMGMIQDERVADAKEELPAEAKKRTRKKKVE